MHGNPNFFSHLAFQGIAGGWVRIHEFEDLSTNLDGGCLLEHSVTAYTSISFRQ
jgi:hypothetical protein